MANKLYEENYVKDIADAIREKNGTENKYKVSEMGAAVRAIAGAAEPVLQDKDITENGTYTPDSGFDGFSEVTVNVDAEPVLQDKTITENGTYTPGGGYDGFGKVTVDVAGTSGIFGIKHAKNATITLMTVHPVLLVTAKDTVRINKNNLYGGSNVELVASE